MIVALAATILPVSADGTLDFSIGDEATQRPTISRVELIRGTPGSSKSAKITPRRTVDAGLGFVLDREIALELADGNYQFRLIRGPEYRIITGNFSLEKTSEDAHHVDLPRMVSMIDKGWVSGDMAVEQGGTTLAIRMAGEDLHVAAVAQPNPIGGDALPSLTPGRSPDDPIDHSPLWIRPNLVFDRGLAIYGTANTNIVIDPKRPAIANAAAAKRDQQVFAAIENPFADELPIWLASQRIDGFFLLGDWLRLDRKVTSVPEGRPFPWRKTGGMDVGRWAETIYWNSLDAGFRMVPLGGGGDDSGKTPLGYNRTYATSGLPRIDEVHSSINEATQSTATETKASETKATESLETWWQNVWWGQTMVTNGPMLRCMVNDHPPGHVFKAAAGQTVSLDFQLDLATRDPVDYLEVIHNGRIHFTAKLDEFARSGGVIPTLETGQSGWVLARVVTLFPDHFRAASTAPWYVEVGGQTRITSQSCRFFQTWLNDFESERRSLSSRELAALAPMVKAARSFWDQRLKQGLEFEQGLEIKIADEEDK
jgi:hypothetical protein